MRRCCRSRSRRRRARCGQESDRGLSPPDLAIHVVLPEIDGRLFAGVASFKQAEAPDPELGYGRTRHHGDDQRIAAIVSRACGWIRLRRIADEHKRLALVLSSYPGRDDQIAHAVGLDAPASAVEMLTLLRREGFAIEDAPAKSAELIERLTSETVRWPLRDYQAVLTTSSIRRCAPISAQWGAPETDPALDAGDFVFKVMRCGHALIAAQPDRGGRTERSAEYHDPRRAPRHSYVAFYLWLRHDARCDALIHVGAHGTLEWLPGKSVALSSACWSDALLGPTPLLYPFIVNDPGEAAAAKRRLGAVTIGHMTPPVSAGKLPPGLQTIEQLLDEYSVAEGLDPRRRERLAESIITAARAVRARPRQRAQRRHDAARGGGAARHVCLRRQDHAGGRRPAHLRPTRRIQLTPRCRSRIAPPANVPRCSRRWTAAACRPARPARPGAAAPTCCRPAATCSPSIRARCRAATPRCRASGSPKRC